MFKTKPEVQVRLILTDILAEVLEQKRALTWILPKYLKKLSDPRDQALTQFCAYGICRHFFRLHYFIKKLSAKPIKDKKIYYLLLVGIFQLESSTVPDFAVVNTLVETTKKLKLFSAAGLVNAVLREFMRQREDLLISLEKDPTVQYEHPAWLIDMLQKAWPDHWRTILMANNQLPPMWLRINQRQVDPAVYVNLLQKHNLTVQSHAGIACCLREPVDVMQLPNFQQGWVSVQDGAAQYAAELLDLQPGQRVLDACAAPGGKTAHILEQEPQLAEVIALDKDADRVKKIQENLQRLNLTAKIITHDATHPAAWWDKQLFDRILIDAPCSATGVIRRHPDIKLLRTLEDILSLTQQQAKLLSTLWPLLKPHGKLVYATCSILPQENEQVIATFCQHHPDAQPLPIHITSECKTPHGRQLLPGEYNKDGFFYAVLQKAPAHS